MSAFQSLLSATILAQNGVEGGREESEGGKRALNMDGATQADRETALEEGVAVVVRSKRRFGLGGQQERNSIPFPKILQKIFPSFEICLNFKLPY